MVVVVVVIEHTVGDSSSGCQRYPGQIYLQTERARLQLPILTLPALREHHPLISTPHQPWLRPSQKIGHKHPFLTIIYIFTLYSHP